MQVPVHFESGLSKATWTDQDLDAMSWDSCQIHAFAVTDDEGPPDDLPPEEFLEQDDLDDTAPSGLTLHLDLDYIVRRVEPPVYLRRPPRRGRRVLRMADRGGISFEARSFA
jgi:hypothetical protein